MTCFPNLYNNDNSNNNNNNSNNNNSNYNNNLLKRALVLYFSVFSIGTSFYALAQLSSCEDPAVGFHLGVVSEKLIHTIVYFA